MSITKFTSFRLPFFSALSLQRQAAPMLLSLAVLSVALALLWVGHWVNVTIPETLTIREIDVFQPPPPPPPPPVAQQTFTESPIALQAEGGGPALRIVQPDRQPIRIARPDAPAVQTAQPRWQSLEVNWDAFSLNELDKLPTLLTPLRIVLPKSLSRRGIDSVLIKLDVLIDEHGQVSLIGVLENPYPELKPEIDDMVRNSRFTAPEKHGEKVRARFIWPVEIKS